MMSKWCSALSISAVGLLAVILFRPSALAQSGGTIGTPGTPSNRTLYLSPSHVITLSSCKEGWIKVTVPSSVGTKEKCVAAGDLEDPIGTSSTVLPMAISGSISSPQIGWTENAAPHNQ